MQSRVDKERKLKRNVEINTERAIRYRQEDEGRELSSKEKQYYRDAFQASAEEIDRSGKLTQVWNEESKAERVGEKRPVFGYFGGVNMDKSGKIIR